MAESVGQSTLRDENISRIVDGFALQEFVMKPLCMVKTSSAWKETYFQETAADLTASGTRNVRGVSRLAQFPYAEVTWTEKSAFQVKAAVKTVISWEDAMSDSIDVVARSLLRIARAVTKAVDDNIWDVISESQSPSLINSVTIAAGDEWDSDTIANRDPIQDILNAKKEINLDNYNSNRNGKLLLNETDFANLMGNPNIRNAGQFFTADATRNGVVGRMLNLDIVVSNTVTDDYGMVMIAKESATYDQLESLRVKTTEDSGVSWEIRAWELGVAKLTNPEAVCLLLNTQK